MDQKIKNICQKNYLLILHLLKKSKTLSVQYYIASAGLLRHYKLIQPTLVPQQDRLPTQNFFCYLLIYAYPKFIHTQRKKNILAKKIELLYKDIEKNRFGKMRLQTDQEFKQRNIEELNKKINVKMCSTHLRGRTKILWTKKTFIKKQKYRKI